MVSSPVRMIILLGSERTTCDIISVRHQEDNCVVRKMTCDSRKIVRVVLAFEMIIDFKCLKWFLP